MKFLEKMSDTEVENECQCQKVCKKPSVKDKFSKTYNQADTYLKTHQINEFFNFLLCHLITNQPPNPIIFLLDLLKKLKLYRDDPENQEVPLLFQERHIESIFRAMDPMGVNLISMNQYKIGLTTMGIPKFNLEPPVTRSGMVTKNIFMDEAKRCQEFQIRDLIQFGPDYKILKEGAKFS